VNPVAVRIRLKRAGSRHRPFYRVIVTDSRNPRDGAEIESLGYYNPLADPEEIRIDERRYEHWIGTGASASDAVKALLKRLRRRAAGQEPAEATKEPAVESAAAEAEGAGGRMDDAAEADDPAPDEKREQ